MRSLGPAVLILLLLAPFLAGCAGSSPTWDGRGRAVLDRLAAQRQDGRFDPFLVPYLAEAAVRNGLEPTEWPSDHPIADNLTIPSGPSVGYGAKLRPAFALALANPGDRDVESQVRAVVLSGFDGNQFGDPTLTLDDAYALFALEAIGTPASQQAQASAGFLLAHANATGGWSYRVGGSPDTDSTGMVVAALAGAFATPPASTQAFFAATADTKGVGGWGAAPGEKANCDSTAWAIRAGIALHQPVPDSAWAYLAALRRTDGTYSYQAGGVANALCAAEIATLFGVAAQESVPVPTGISFE